MAAAFYLALLAPALLDKFIQGLEQVSQWFAQGLKAVMGYILGLGPKLAHLPAQVSPVVSSPAIWHPVLYGVLILVMLVGVVGAIVPTLPGITLILGAIVVWGLVVGFAGLTWALAVAIAALLLSIGIDYLAGILGAQRVGASHWGQIGAFVGMFLGLFGLLPFLPTGIPLLGILLGTVLGAFIGEFVHRRELNLSQRTLQSGRVGLAIVVGTLVGNILQAILALITVLVFIATTWSGL